ncbi:SNF2 family N-terminal domain-containing protein, partial [Blastocladiella britannica]
MGLGKTLQCVSFLQYIHIHEWRFPFLVVVPNSTLENWEREFNKWAPQLHVVSNWGPQVDRDLIAKYELFQLGSDGRPKRSSSLGYSLKCHVVLASYESVMKTSEFKDVRWDCLIVDEGHRLKNDESKLFLHLKELSFDHKILLTGTPLQNNLRELFNLMNFLDPEQFQDPESLAIEYNLRDNSGSTAPTPASVKELHALLRPHFLRRIKADIDLDVPPKAEILVPVRMTPLQRQLIKELYSSNFQLIRALGSQAKARSDAAEGSLHNLLVQSRKILSHPF